MTQISVIKMSIVDTKATLSEGMTLCRKSSAKELSMGLDELHAGLIARIEGDVVTVVHHTVDEGKLAIVMTTVERFLCGYPLLGTRKLTMSELKVLFQNIKDLSYKIMIRDAREVFNVMLTNDAIDPCTHARLIIAIDTVGTMEHDMIINGDIEGLMKTLNL